jgi:DNA ligase-1
MAMLAIKWKPDTVDYSGWFASSKQDGYRAIWTGVRLQSRHGRAYVAPDWFTRRFPSDIALDGELLVPGADFEAHGALLRHNISDPVWDVVEFRCFAMPDSGHKFQDVIPLMQRYHGHGPIRVLAQQVIASNTDAWEMATQIIADGGEGLVLRHPDSKYVNTRTPDLVKIKATSRALAEIVGRTIGTGRNSKRIGAYVCRFLDDNTEGEYVSDDLRNTTDTFNIGGLTDDMRENPLPTGTVITVGYQNLTRYRLPRFPRLIL